MPFSSRRLTCSWMALVLPLGASFIFFYGRKRADMGGCRRRLDGAVLGRLWALGCGLWAKMGTHRDGAATGRRGRLPYGEAVRVSAWRTVLCSVSCLGEKGQRNGNKRWKGPANKREWGMLPRTSMGQDRFLTGRTAKAALTTFITGEFNRGWWTSAVQGPKKANYFFGGPGGGRGRFFQRRVPQWTIDLTRPGQRNGLDYRRSPWS